MNKQLKRLLPDVEEHIWLASYTTFQIGGFAEYFFIAKSSDEVLWAIHAARELDMPFFILGGGSNLLISDNGFSGLVIKIQNTRFTMQNEVLDADAGISMPELVRMTGDAGLEGLEWAGGLPGTLGGAIRGNAGAFGGEIKDRIIDVSACDSQGNLGIYSKEQCEFSYRSSIFKKNNFIVLSARIALAPGDMDTIVKTARHHIQYRKDRHPLEYPNAGSIFKNCDINLFPKNEWSKFEHVVKNDPFPVVPAAHLISEAGLKGLSIGEAAVSPKHPNFIVNRGGARATDVFQLSETVKAKVREKFGVLLEREIQLVGKF